MKHQKTLRLVEVAKEILAANNPMTVRQIYYQLVSRQVIKNNRSTYQGVSNALVDARKEGEILWHLIEDRLRIPRTVSMWSGLSDFADTVISSYRRNVWESQPTYLEVWLEKDALSGIFEDCLLPYGVTLNVGRGYDGWDSIHNAAERFNEKEEAGKLVTVLYFGDLDPSGEDMLRSLQERLAFFKSSPEIVKCALTREDIDTYNLPPDFAKTTDTRYKNFVEKNGDISVELDALPMDVLKVRLKTEVERRLHLKALKVTLDLQRKDQKEIRRRFK